MHSSLFLKLIKQFNLKVTNVTNTQCTITAPDDDSQYYTQLNITKRGGTRLNKIKNNCYNYIIVLEDVNLNEVV